ncbi:hypothetical protein F6Y04_34825 [Bacillus megaterium]|nr:hypothetical protein [Priestia megaterium]
MHTAKMMLIGSVIIARLRTCFSSFVRKFKTTMVYYIRHPSLEHHRKNKGKSEKAPP